MRFAPDKKDANHREIVESLKAYNYDVLEIRSPVDLAIFNNGWSGLCEIKTDTTEYKRIQLETAVNYPRIPIAYVKTVNEALHFVKTGKGITEDQRQRIAIALSADKDRERWTAAMMRRILNG